MLRTYLGRGDRAFVEVALLKDTRIGDATGRDERPRIGNVQRLGDQDGDALRPRGGGRNR